MLKIDKVTDLFGTIKTCVYSQITKCGSSKIVQKANDVFLTIAPRKSGKRFVCTKVIPITVIAGVGLGVLLEVGHISLSGDAKHAQHHEDFGGIVLDSCIGLLIALCSVFVFAGGHEVFCFATTEFRKWQQKENLEIDLEKGAKEKRES